MPHHDERETLQIGLIGMGDMGQLYASKLVEAGYKQRVTIRRYMGIHF